MFETLTPSQEFAMKLIWNNDLPNLAKLLQREGFPFRLESLLLRAIRLESYDCYDFLFEKVREIHCLPSHESFMLEFGHAVTPQAVKKYFAFLKRIPTAEEISTMHPFCFNVFLKDIRGDQLPEYKRVAPDMFKKLFRTNDSFTNVPSFTSVLLNMLFYFPLEEDVMISILDHYNPHYDSYNSSMKLLLCDQFFPTVTSDEMIRASMKAEANGVTKFLIESRRTFGYTKIEWPQRFEMFVYLLERGFSPTIDFWKLQLRRFEGEGTLLYVFFKLEGKSSFTSAERDDILSIGHLNTPVKNMIEAMTGEL